MIQKDSVVLAFGAHPDDVELNAGGTLLLADELSIPVHICHLTNGEMGTRGTEKTRQEEACAAAEVLGAHKPIFLGMKDGKLEVSEENKDKVIRVIRETRPTTILAPYWEDLHPDHAAAGALIKQANFLSGLVRWDTGQEPWRSPSVLYYMSHTSVEASVVVDISEQLLEKKRAAECYRSQFFQEDSKERSTFISGENFWGWWEGRASYWGHFVGARFGEPYFIEGPIPLSQPFDLFHDFGKYKNS